MSLSVTDEVELLPLTSATWPRHGFKYFAEFLKEKCKRGELRNGEIKVTLNGSDKLADYKIAVLGSAYRVPTVLKALGAKELPGWGDADGIYLGDVSEASLLMGELGQKRAAKKRRRLYHSNHGTDEMLSEGAAYVVKIGDGLMVFAFEPLLSGDVRVTGITLVMYKSVDQVRTFMKLYTAELRKLYSTTEVIVDFNSGATFPRPEVSMDDVVMPEDFKRELLANTLGFFKTREVYAKLGVPWKRGIILTGDPGTGKTFFLKALARSCPYTFGVVRITPETRDSELRLIFQRAVDASPCVVVLEDLDRAQQFGFNLSTLLNILDGLEEADGLMTIATANRPDQIDPALSSRPSRFDRVYRFPLPTSETRLSMLARLCNGSFSQAALQTASTDADKFSLAMIKEAVLTAFSYASLSGRDPVDSDLATGVKTMKESIQAVKDAGGTVGFKANEGNGATPATSTAPPVPYDSPDDFEELPDGWR